MGAGDASHALTRAQILARSSNLKTPGFAGAYERHLSAKTILLVVDCDAEIGTGDVLRHHRELVAALTPEEVIVLRASGAIRSRARWRPKQRVWIIDLRALVELHITPQGDLSISYSQPGQAGLLKLRLGSRALADRWMSRIDDAFWMPK